MGKLLAIFQLIPNKIKFALGGTLLVLIEHFVKPLGALGSVIVNAISKVLETIGMLPGVEDAAQMAMVLLA